MIIDGHSHAYAEFSTINSLKEIMKDLSVDKIVLCPSGDPNPQNEPMRPKTRKTKLMFNHHIIFFSNRYLRFISRNIRNRDLGNEYVHELVKKLPEKLIQFYWVNPNDEDYFETLMDKYHKWRFKGLKLHQAVVNFKCDSEEMERMARFAAVHMMPIFIHIFNPREAKKLVKLAREHPATNFIIAHLMGLETVIKHGKDLTNIYFDISPYYIISEKRILKAVKYFGADHVILGSDSPLGIDNLKNNITKIKNMEKLKVEQKKLILGENILRLLPK